MDLMLGPVRCPAILVFVGSVKCCSSSIVLSLCFDGRVSSSFTAKGSCY